MLASLCVAPYAWSVALNSLRSGQGMSADELFRYTDVSAHVYIYHQMHPWTICVFITQVHP